MTITPQSSNEAIVSLRWIELSALTDLDALARSWLTTAEWREWNGLNHPERRREWLAGRMCLKGLVQSACGADDPRQLEIQKTDRGRPFVAAVGNTSQPIGDGSLSHAGGWAVAAWTSEPDQSIGIDLELIGPRIGRVAGAIRSVDDTACRNRQLREQQTIWWCLKEAYSKAVGLGIAAGWDTIGCRETLPRRHEIRWRREPAGSGRHWRWNGMVLALCQRRQRVISRLVDCSA